VPLGITDAVALDDGRVLVSAAAEDTDDPVADGPVSAAALAVLDGEELVAWTLLPADASGAVPKVEGLASWPRRSTRWSCSPLSTPTIPRSLTGAAPDGQRTLLAECEDYHRS
jgi:hypothetical protein